MHLLMLLQHKVRYVNLIPFSAATSLNFLRCATSSVTSTSSINVTCGAVCLELTIAFAIALRIPLIFSRVSGNSPSRELVLLLLALCFVLLHAATSSDSVACLLLLAACACPPFKKLRYLLSIHGHFFQNPATCEYLHLFHEHIYEQMASQ